MNEQYDVLAKRYGAILRDLTPDNLHGVLGNVLVMCCAHPGDRISCTVFKQMENHLKCQKEKEAAMDCLLVELIETVGDVHPDDAAIWCPMTPQAREEWDDEYFVDESDEKHEGCMYIGTVGDAKKSIAAMNKELTHAA